MENFVLFIHLGQIPSVFQYGIGTAFGAAIQYMMKGISWIFGRDERKRQAEQEVEKIDAAAEAQRVQDELAKEQSRAAEIQGLRDYINGLRDIINELRVSRDEANDSRKLLTALVEQLRSKQSDLELEMRRRDEKCEERVSLIELNSEKRIELLKRQHTEEIAQLARQFTTQMGTQHSEDEAQFQGKRRHRGSEPTIESGVAGVRETLERES